MLKVFMILCSVSAALPLALRGDGAPELPPASRVEMEQAAGMKFPDMIEAGSGAYQALKKAADAARSKSWLLPRLQDGRAVPQASARELVLDLLDNEALEAGLKADLKKYFPSETTQFLDHRPDNEAELERLKPKIEAMEKRLDLITQTMFKNVYNKGTFPSASVNLDTGYQDGAGNGLLLGHDATHFASISIHIAGQLPEGSFAVDTGGEFRTPWAGNRTLIGATGASLSLGNWQIRYGERDSVNFSSLVYSGVSTPNVSLFHNSAADPVGIGLGPVGVGPASELWDLRRISQPSAYWPFSEAHVLFSPHNQFYESWNANKLYDLAGRFDFSPLQAWIFSDIKPFITGVYTYGDEAQDRAAGFPNPIIQQDLAYAGGLELTFVNGSTLIAEVGTSSWQRGDLTDGFQDTAYYGLATLPAGDFTFVVEGSQIGPRYITGGNAPRLSDNGQAGAYFDTMMDDFERQGGKTKTFSYQSNIRDPQAMTNNSRRVAFKAEAKGSWLTLGLTYVYSEQIEPSGPWVQSHFILNGLDYNGAGMFYRFGDSYGVLAYNTNAAAITNVGQKNQWAFAHENEAYAYYQGKPFANGAHGVGPIYWTEIGQLIFHETQTFILLSQKGPGDPNSRPDSIKYLDAYKGTMNADLKPVFNRDLPADLIVNTELRDLNETPGMPEFDEEHLLVQMSSDLTLRWGLSQTITFLGTIGYEAWSSQQTFDPVRWIARYGGLGLDFKLDEIMSGMNVSVRTDRYEFEDSYFGGRSYTAWGWRIGTGISY
jgi:hypothetical protein